MKSIGRSIVLFDRKTRLAACIIGGTVGVLAFAGSVFASTSHPESIQLTSNTDEVAAAPIAQENARESIILWNNKELAFFRLVAANQLTQEQLSAYFAQQEAMKRLGQIAARNGFTEEQITAYLRGTTVAELQLARIVAQGGFTEEQVTAYLNGITVAQLRFFRLISASGFTSDQLHRWFNPPPPPPPPPPAPSPSVVGSGVGASRWANLVAQYPWNVNSAMCILNAESGGNPGAHSPTNDYGLFQVNAVHSARVGGNLSALFDPATNVRVAYQIYVDNAGWGPWTTRYKCGV